MKVFLTGGTGFVGGHVLAELKRRGHEVAALVRRPGSLQGAAEMVGDVAHPETFLADRLRGCQAAIHLVGIIREFPRRGVTFERLHVEATRNVLSACQEAGIRRYVHMSALGARLDSAAAYHRTKARAEELVRRSGLDWTIIRPGVILGPDGEFFRMISGMVRRRVVPLIGDGSSLMAPVAVATVAQAFVRALENEGSIGRTYDLGGEVVTYRRVMEILAEAMGKRVVFVKSPVFWLKFMAALLDRFAFFPLTREQITMAQEAAVPEDNKIYEELGLDFKGVGEIIKILLK